MCHVLNHEKKFKTSAYFSKASEPAGMGYKFEGTAIPCRCGAKTWFRPTKYPSQLIEVKLVEDINADIRKP